MFSDPNLSEWISGLIAAIFCLGAVIVVSMVMARILVKVWGEDEAPVSLSMPGNNRLGWETRAKLSA